MRVNREALRAIRKRSGYNLPALAKQAGVTTSCLCDLERGRRNGTKRTLIALAKALDVPLEAIVLDRPSRSAEHVA